MYPLHLRWAQVKQLQAMSKDEILQLLTSEAFTTNEELRGLYKEEHDHPEYVRFVEHRQSGIYMECCFYLGIPKRTVVALPLQYRPLY